MSVEQARAAIMAYGIRLGMACIVMAMMLVLLQGAIGAPGFALRENWEFTDEFAFAEQDNGTNGTLANVVSVLELRGTFVTYVLNVSRVCGSTSIIYAPCFV